MWFKQYGYSQNPLVTNTMKEKTDIIGRENELEDAIYYVSIGSMFYVQSNEGCGKTKLLKAIIKNFKGKIIYVDASKIKKNLDIEDLLAKKNGLFGSMFSDLPKNMILLLDNADELTQVNFERLKFFFDNDFIRSIVFTGNSFEKSKLPKSIKHRISNRVIKLSNLDLHDVVEIINNKLETTIEDSIFGFDIIKKVFEKEKNIKKILRYLDMSAEEMVSKDLEKVTPEIIDSILKYTKLHEEEFKENIIDSDGTKLEKFGEYYRNPSKDIYCSNCGAIVDFTDDDCPECGMEFEKEIEEEEEEKETKKKKKETKSKSSKEKETKAKPKKKKSKSKNKKVN